MLRLPLLTGALLLAPFAFAESPMPDPVAPAVIGRPLEQIAPARPKRATAQPKVVRQQDTPAVRAPKQAVDDRADPRMRLDGVGQGTRFARKPLGPGAYFGDKHRTAARKYYQEHPASGAAASWRIGEPLPSGAKVTSVPQGLLASLPRVPPGHSYVQLGGEVVLIASGSRMVVDGISRKPR